MKTLFFGLVAACAVTAFAEDGWISTVGTDGSVVVLNTEYRPTAQTTIELDFLNLDAASAGEFRILGSRKVNVGDELVYLLYQYNGDYGCSFAKGSVPWCSAGGAAASDRRVTAILDLYRNHVTFMENGVTNTTSWIVDPAPAAATATDRPVVIGNAWCTYDKDYPTRLYENYPTKLKVYGCRIYERGDLVRDFIPAVKNGIPGLYDRLHRTFVHQVVDTGAVLPTTGGDIRSFADDGYVVLDGTQDYQTDVKADQDTRLELDFAFTNPTAEGEHHLFGCTGESGKLDLRTYAVNAWGLHSFGISCAMNGEDFKDFKSDSLYGTTMTLCRQKYVVDVPARLCSLVRGVQTNFTYAISSLAAGTTCETRLPVGIGSALGNSPKFTALRIYSFKVYKSGELVRDYRPYKLGAAAVLRDGVTGSWIRTRQGSDVAFGGDIRGDGPYLQSDATQVIDTGYKATEKTRIEVDFEQTDPQISGERYAFGSRAGTVGGLINFIFQYNGSYGWVLQKYAGVEPRWNSTGVSVDNERVTCVMDLKANVFALEKAGATVFTAKADAGDGEPLPAMVNSYPIALFGINNDGVYTESRRVPMKLYGCRIYEDGELVHDFVPYRDATRVGLFDLRTGVVREDAAGSATPFVTGGRGCHLFAAKTAIGVGKSVTLTAVAPDAVRYVWTKNGIPLAGETGSTLVVRWTSDENPSAYGVSAVYAFDGGEVFARAPETAVLTNKTSGMVLLFR